MTNGKKGLIVHFIHICEHHVLQSNFTEMKTVYRNFLMVYSDLRDARIVEHGLSCKAFESNAGNRGSNFAYDRSKCDCHRFLGDDL